MFTFKAAYFLLLKVTGLCKKDNNWHFYVYLNNLFTSSAFIVLLQQQQQQILYIAAVTHLVELKVHLTYRLVWVRKTMLYKTEDGGS